METKEDLIDRIVKEQDLICIYVVKHHNKSFRISDMYSKDNDVTYSNIDQFIFANPQILDRLNTKNLLHLLSNAYKDDDQKILLNIINQRLKTENFFCEDIDDNFFMQVSHSSDRAINRLGEDNVNIAISNIKKRLEKTKGTNIENVASNIKFLDDASNFLHYFENDVFTDKKIALLEKMINKNEDALKYVNFGIFQDSIFDIGETFVEYISKFTDISAQMVCIANHNPKLMKVLGNRISSYENLAENIDEIEILITYFARNCFDIDLNKEVVIDDLIECAFRNSTSLNKQIQYKTVNVPFGEKYQERLQKEYEDRYALAKGRDKKLNLYLEKVFSLTKEGAQNLIKDYGADLENIEGLTEGEKNFIYKLKESVNIKDESEIDLLFSKAKNIYKPSQIFNIRKSIAKACAKSYVNEMKDTDKNIDKIEEENIEFNGKQIKQVKLTGKFSMLLHSTDTGYNNKAKKLETEADFRKLWERKKDKENHIISTTFVNQDFLGTSPVGENGVRYAFTAIPIDNIKLMGVTDINTYCLDFAYDSAEKTYMSAKTLPYNSRRVYSEIGIERDGVKPDYVVVFDDDSIEVKNNSYRAASQFNIPAIFIDKAEIEKQQIDNLNMLLSKFDKERNIEDLKTLVNHFETNRAGWLLNRVDYELDESFTESISNSRFEEDFNNIEGKIEKTVKDYLSLIKEGKSNYSTQELTEVMEILLKEIELYRNSEKVKPISKTQISFDAYGLVQEVNSTMEKIGMAEYTVTADKDKLPTLEEYRLTIKQIVANALTGKNAVNIHDIEEAYKQMNIDKERDEFTNDK